MGGGTHAAFGDVVRVPHDVTGQAEVTDLDQLALTDEYIPGCQVSVDTLGRGGDVGRGRVLRHWGQLWGKTLRVKGSGKNASLPGCEGPHGVRAFAVLTQQTGQSCQVGLCTWRALASSVTPTP